MSDELNNLLLGDIEVEVEPSDGDQDRDVYNRLITLYGSRVGEQTLDREFGLDISCLSLPAESGGSPLDRGDHQKDGALRTARAGAAG